MIALLHTESSSAVLRPGDVCQFQFQYGEPLRFIVKQILVRYTALADGHVVDPQPTVLDRLFHVRLDGERSFGPLLLDASTGWTLYTWTLTAPISLRVGDSLIVEITAAVSFGITNRAAPDAVQVDVLLDGVQIQRDEAQTLRDYAEA